MLKCAPVKPSKIDLSCGTCRKCSGVSTLDYPFDRDLYDSDSLVRAIMDFVKETTGYRCERTEINKNPDINVFAKDGSILCRIEAKYLEGQAFMKSRYYTTLQPREALAVDEPKLQSYFERKAEDRKAGKDIPIFLVWQYDRPCNDIGGIAVFQEIDVLHQIYAKIGGQRAFERKTSYNDYKNGKKLGVTKKYHFSLRECEPIEDLPKRIKALRPTL